MREWCKYCGEGDGVCETCRLRAELKAAETRIGELEAMLEADRAQHAEIRDSRHATATTVLEGYKAHIAELEQECGGHIKAYLDLNEGLREYETRIARAVAELDKALARKSPWRAHVVVALKALR